MKIVKALRALNRRRRRTRNLSLIKQNAGTGPRSIEPIWPLPNSGNLTDDKIRERFADFEQWHYGYEFDGGLKFHSSNAMRNDLTEVQDRPLMRFRHFMPWLVEACGGSLKGKTVLDIACNSGFWSLQCALLGAKVVGFDARDELIEQANLLKEITGVENVEYRKLDFWSMSPETLGGQFDVVLNLGILYHLPKPLEALELTRAMTKGVCLLDTSVSPSKQPIIALRWEVPVDVRDAAEVGVVTYPSRSATELMLRHAGFSEWKEIPLRSADMPGDYLAGNRTSWIIRA